MKKDKKFRLDISNKKRSMTHILNEHREDILFMTDPQQIIESVQKIFDDAGLKTEASERLIYRLKYQCHNNPVTMVMLISNSIMAGSGLATY